MEQLSLPRRGRRDGAWLVLFEFAVILALFVADFRHHIFFSKVPWLFLLAWVSLRWRELGWRDVGLARPANWPRAITIGVLCGIGMELLELFVIQPVLVKVFHKIPDFSELGDLQDNWNWLCSLSHWLRSWVPLVKRWSIAVI